MLDWVIENKEWFLSGIGVAAIVTIGGMIFRRKQSDTTRQSIVSGKARDITQTINTNDK